MITAGFFVIFRRYAPKHRLDLSFVRFLNWFQYILIGKMDNSNWMRQKVETVLGKGSKSLWITHNCTDVLLTFILSFVSKNKSFVYRGQEYEKIGSFNQRIRSQFPDAQVKSILLADCQLLSEYRKKRTERAWDFVTFWKIRSSLNLTAHFKL